MAGNASLRKADKVKNDEFYTQLSDIEKELKHYKKHFKDKIVFCNCDDPYESNFFKYFAMNFNFLGLKKLVATCYKGSPIVYTQLNKFGGEETSAVIQSEKRPYKIEITEVVDANGDGAIDLTDVEYLLRNKNNVLTLLKSDGDFRSDECIEILKQADIVVTNPPFSLLREYVAQLIANNKKFLIVSNQNSITYKEIFPLIKDNKLWLGYNAIKEFKKPDGKLQKFGNVCWFTNLDIVKRQEELELYKKYTPEQYPKYDNYDAINVDRISEIPEDYFGNMGVPITFVQSYNPDQFEIIDALNRYALLDIQNTNEYVRSIHSHTCNINGVATYFRIVIRRKQNGN